MREVRLAIASERRERATRSERAGEAEIGIRMAVGATPARIVSRFLAFSAGYVLVGAIASVALSVAMVYGFTIKLPAILPQAPLERAGPFAAAAAALGIVAALAVVVPAGRAARVNPTTALRDE